MSPKRLAKNLLCRVLEAQVRHLRQRHDFKLVAVAGSLGKTSTKLAVATVLQQGRRTLVQQGNYNDRLTVPLVLLRQDLPNLLNGFAWWRILSQNRRLIKNDYPYDVVVVELGTDGPGQIAEFAYLKPDIAVVTAVAPEHMEFFKTLDTVADEELAVASFARKLLVNRDDISAKYLEGKQYLSYASDSADYTVKSIGQADLKTNKAQLKLIAASVEVNLQTPGKQGQLVALAAAAVADQLGLSADQIRAGVNAIEPFAGRLRILNGLNQSVIIDDSYNASPVAVMAGLDVLYQAPASQRIAILGSMNELGDYSAEAHADVAAYCDPSKLDLVVTIGREAKDYLVPAAAERGCKVEAFDSPYDAGRFVKEQLRSGSVILAEGSQNGVFAEEAVKLLLENADDAQRLVRQSAHWDAVKKRQFPKQ